MDGKEYIERQREIIERVDKLNKIGGEIIKDRQASFPKYDEMIAALEKRIAILEAKVANLQSRTARLGPNDFEL